METSIDLQQSAFHPFAEVPYILSGGFFCLLSVEFLLCQSDHAECLLTEVLGFLGYNAAQMFEMLKLCSGHFLHHSHFPEGFS